MVRWRRSSSIPFIALLLLVFFFFRFHSSFPVPLDPGIAIAKQKNNDYDSMMAKEEEEVASAQFLSFANDGSKIKGKKFSKIALEGAKIVDQVRGNSVETFKNEEVVFVIYASSNHFLESREAIRKLRLISNATLVYYDLGLLPEQADELRQLCRVRYVKFTFDAYPDFVEELETYAFKPIIMGEMYSQYKAFWVIDASARFFSLKNMNFFYERVRRGEIEPFSAEHPTGHTIKRATHPKMYEYLPLPEKVKESGMRQALTMFVVRSPISKEIVRWNMLCALEKNCVAPSGSTVGCDESNINGKSKKSVCHRFDQSSVNIVMCASRLRRGLPCLSAKAKSGAYSSFADVSRDTIYKGNLLKC